MSSKAVDFEAMLREIKAVYEKYGIPRGIGFVPDKLEISFQRIEPNKFSLIYEESFSYLPDYALNFAIQEAIQILQQLGLPISNIIRLEKGIRIELTADLSVVASFIISEFLIQEPLEESKFLTIVNSAKKSKEIFADFLDLNLSWDENTANRFNKLLQKLAKTTREHPAMQSEIKEIVKKYIP